MTTLPSEYDPDSIEAYLQALPISSGELKQAGGVLNYWESALSTRPRLARMALDFLSAPGVLLKVLLYLVSLWLTTTTASSVDAERAFSGGRLQVNHLQHGMSSQTFKAQMAIGSWSRTPLMPDLKVPTAIIESQRKEKGKNKAVSDVDHIVVDE